jgi:MFS family permease
VLGGLLTLSSFLKFFPEVNVEHPPPGWSSGKASNVQGITVGGYTLGCFFGAVATIWLGNYLGRRKTIFVGSSIMVVGAALQCSSFELGQLIAARLITGFGNGMVSFYPYAQSVGASPLSSIQCCPYIVYIGSSSCIVPFCTAKRVANRPAVFSSGTTNTLSCRSDGNSTALDCLERPAISHNMCG